jgi:hypothetical protein
MPGTVIGKSLNLGYAGKVSRNPYNQIRARFVKSVLNGSGVETMSNVVFGSPIVLNTDNTVTAWKDVSPAITSAGVFAGIAVSEVKQSMTLSYGANTAGGVYEPLMPADILLSGNCTIVCVEGTPLAGGAVYVTTVAGTTAALGDFTATATPAGAGTALLIPNMKWTSGKQDSATGITEVTINYAVNP